MTRTCRSRSRACRARLARLDKIFGGGEADLATTIENLRQITDNLRDLTEDTKRYPSNVLFGAPPQPAGKVQMNARSVARAARARAATRCSRCSR